MAVLRDSAGCDPESWHKKVYVQRTKEVLFDRTTIEYRLMPIAEKATRTLEGLSADPPIGVMDDPFPPLPLLPDAASRDVLDKRIPHLSDIPESEDDFA